MRFGRVRFVVTELCSSQEQFESLIKEKSVDTRKVAEEIIKRGKSNQNQILLPSKRFSLNES